MSQQATGAGAGATLVLVTPLDVRERADVQLASGVPFLSDDDLESALDEAGVALLFSAGIPTRQPGGEVRLS